MHSLRKIYEKYRQGVNIIEWLKSIDGRTENTFEDIMISYDFQAGTYVDDFMNNRLDSGYMEMFVKFADIINKYLPDQESCKIFEPGIGEATSMYGIQKNIKNGDNIEWYGLDASFSRLKVAQDFLKNEKCERNIKLIMGDMLNLPIASNSCDIVYTVHACEPNGGKELQILTELLRVTKKYLILFEPAYDMAGNEAKRRMEKHGYVTKLFETIKQMNLDVVEHHLLGANRNALNPTGVYVIKKQDLRQEINGTVLADPVSKCICKEYDNCLWCEESMLLYPKIDGIACMLENNAIVSTKYGEL